MKKNKYNSGISKVSVLFITGLIISLLLFSVLIFKKQNTKSTPKSTPQIAVLLPGSVTFFEIQKNAIKNIADKFGLHVTFYNAEWDSKIQIQQLQNAVSTGADIIALATVDNQDLKVAPGIVAKHNIPLITFTNAIGSDPYGYYHNVTVHIGRDEIEAGQLLAKQIESIRGNQKTTIFLIQGAAGTTPQRLRELGFNEIVAQHSNWTILDSAKISNWDSQQAASEVEKIFNSGQKVDIVATQWADAAVSASYVINSLNKKTSIVSLEFNSSIQKEMLEGRIGSTTYYSIANEAELVIKTIVKILQGVTTKRFVSIKQTIIDKSQAINIKPEN
ncbi:MAG: sugar ABC transporter substrate-binding protein [Methylococcaceae bacterium]|nr:sugar ABC transporter substrate-binding protein [Methylococcaceae bacterium]